MKHIFLLITLLWLPAALSATTYADTAINYRSRRIILASGSALFTVGSLGALHQAWYSAYNTGKFHLFNDNREWLQMDKAGHCFAAYQSGRLMMEAFEWAGFSRGKQLWIGGTLGCGYLTAVEIMDGYSRGWGYSWGDQLANVLGAATAISQEALWQEQKFQLKFSYAASGLAKYNPSLLGENLPTRILKDYNSQIYWLSFNPVRLVNQHAKFPRWLHLALGYSAYGMTGGHYNTPVSNPEGTMVFMFERKRQFLLSLDIDLTAIPTRSRFLKSLFSIFNVLKVPAPTFKIDKNGGQLLLL